MPSTRPCGGERAGGCRHLLALGGKGHFGSGGGHPRRGRLTAVPRVPSPRLSGEEFRAEAAARSRAGIERRRESILVSARPILHTAVAASLAWLVAIELFDHPRPFFAPVAAVITLGLSLGQRRRRAVEMAFGVALGILVADLLVARSVPAPGRSAW